MLFAAFKRFAYAFVYSVCFVQVLWPFSAILLQYWIICLSWCPTMIWDVQREKKKEMVESLKAAKQIMDIFIVDNFRVIIARKSWKRNMWEIPFSHLFLESKI